MSYFKFTSEKALTAWSAIQAKDAELRKQSMSFAALFGGIPVHSTSITSTTFHGVLFSSSPYVSAALWTKPAQKDGYSRRPRARAPKGLETEHAALKLLWNGQAPTESVDLTELYPAIGLDWGMLFLTGLHMFRFSGAVYVETGATPAPEADPIEILGSEFHAARKAYEVSKESAE